MNNSTQQRAIEKLRNTTAQDIADLIWEKSVRGFDSVLSYNPDTDELEVSVFSTGTVWNDQSRSLYLCRFADPLTIEVYNWSELGDEFREYDGYVDLSEFAASRGIDLEERFRNIHDFYLTEDTDIVKDLLEELETSMPPVYCYASNQFESPLAEMEAWENTDEECHEELLRQFAEWQDIPIESLKVVWCPQSGKNWIWEDGEQTDVWIDTEGETMETIKTECKPFPRYCPICGQELETNPEFDNLISNNSRVWDALECPNGHCSFTRTSYWNIGTGQKEGIDQAAWGGHINGIAMY